MDRLISIVIPTFDRADLTDRAIQSVVCSMPDQLEVIVVDDCGTIPYHFARGQNASGIVVHVFRLLVNVGPGIARKAGVQFATGRFIAFLDSDDYFDKEWIGHAIAELRKRPVNEYGQLMVSGITMGEKRMGSLVRKWLASLPAAIQLDATRMIVTMFNPFYTQSIVVSRELCFFKEGLRHCEDYYSTAMALFHARTLLLPTVVACYLSRPPNSAGGESAAHTKMFWGEMEVRQSLLMSSSVPLGYKLLLPVGMLYQLVRVGLKRLRS